VTRLLVLDQANVLDRDHSLVREGPEEIELLCGERRLVVAKHHDCAERLAVLQHRHGHRAPESSGRGRLAEYEVRVGGDVRHVHHGARENRATADGAAARAHGVETPQGVGK
jgi:hypothetical protein